MTIEAGAAARHHSPHNDWNAAVDPLSQKALNEARRSLGECILFRGLSPDERKGLVAQARIRNFAAGDTIFLMGSSGDSMMAVLSGTVRISVPSPDGKEIVLAILQPGELLGEIALLDGAARSASVEATETTLVLSLSRQEFFALLRAQPAVLEPLMRQLGTMVRRLTEQTSDHVFLDLAGRVAKALIRLADAPQADHAVVDLSQTQLAELVGGSRQSVNQAIGGFAGRGMLHLEGRHIVLDDLGALRRRAGLR